MTPVLERRRRLGSAIAAVVLLVAGAGAAADQTPGRVPHEWVTDSAHVLSAADRQALASTLSRFHRETQHPIAVLIVPTVGAESIQEFSLRTANDWVLGHPGLNDGILVTLAMKEGRARIDLGTGMVRYLSTADLRAIVEAELVPAFRTGDFGGALRRAVRKLMAKARAFVVTIPERPAGDGAAAPAPKGPR